jgi:hypothetical protein
MVSILVKNKIWLYLNKIVNLLKFENMYFTSSPIFIFVFVFIINFLLAILLKSVNKEVTKQYKNLKYVYIIPPFAMIIWVLALFISFIIFLKKHLTEYFKD